MNDILETLKKIEKELTDNNSDPKLWMEYGIGNHLLGEFQKAVESFHKSLEIDSKNSSCHYNLANSLMELERFNQAIHHFLEAIELKPGHIPSLNNLADAYELSGQPEKAHEIFHYLIHLNPEDPLSHFNLGNFFLRNDQHVEAAKCYEKTLLLDDQFADAYYNIAWILKKVNAPKEAIHYINEGLSADPDHNDLKKLKIELIAEEN